jgi:Ca2+-binding EF-hand superfamily protein
MNQQMIKYSEFLGMVYDAKILLEEENLWIAFKHFDEDNEDLISIDNFIRII